MVNKNKVALVFAALLGGWHVVWSLLVFSGYVETMYSFILWAHMIDLPVTIGPFDGTAAVTLVVVTTIIGYVGGYIAAWVWNRMHRY